MARLQVRENETYWGRAFQGDYYLPWENRKTHLCPLIVTAASGPYEHLYDEKMRGVEESISKSK